MTRTPSGIKINKVRPQEPLNRGLGAKHLRQQLHQHQQQLIYLINSKTFNCRRVYKHKKRVKNWKAKGLTNFTVNKHMKEQKNF